MVSFNKRKEATTLLVSIITAVFNSEKTIARTIESVINQTYSTIEYIIIDANSSDKTMEVINLYKPKITDRGILLKVICGPDKGMYDALNKGAILCSGDLVGQINADDWYEPDAVQKMVDLYNKTNFDTAWGSIRLVGDKTLVKHAKIGKLWTTSGWCHPAMFSKKEMLIKYPYPLESMFDDFDHITALHINNKKLITIDDIISNFSFGKGGMSTKKSFREIKKRVNATYNIYKKYHMSRFYFFYRWIYEMIKYFFA